MCVCVCVCVCVCTSPDQAHKNDTHTPTHIYIYIYMCVCMYVCMYVRTCTRALNGSDEVCLCLPARHIRLQRLRVLADLVRVQLSAAGLCSYIYVYMYVCVSV